MSVFSKAYFLVKAYLAFHVKWSNRLNTNRPENKSFNPHLWITGLNATSIKVKPWVKCSETLLIWNSLWDVHTKDNTFDSSKLAFINRMLTVPYFPEFYGIHDTYPICLMKVFLLEAKITVDCSIFNRQTCLVGTQHIQYLMDQFWQVFISLIQPYVLSFLTELAVGYI